MRRRLDQPHKLFIAEEISRHAVVAADPKHSMHRIARFLIDSLLWCWTADGIDDDGIAKRDLLKYDFDWQYHTEAARLLSEKQGSSKGLIHEHAVPRNEIIRLLLQVRPTAHDTFDILERICFAVVMTREQDLSIHQNDKSLRGSMPFVLQLDTPRLQLFARHEHLKHDLREPRRDGSGNPHNTSA